MTKKKNVVKQTQQILILILGFMVIISWFIVITEFTSNTAEEEQMTLIQSADSLLEDKLYVRATNLYNEAITNYTTEHNAELEVKLLNLYKEGGLYDEYFSLIEERMEKKIATAGEYVSYAESLIKNGSTINAVTILAEGEDLFDDEKLTNLYESVKYENSMCDINLTEMKMPSSDWIIPASDGNKWGYINSGGSVELEFIYEEATRFSGDYAVVKINGIHTLIDKAGNWMAVDKTGLDEVTNISGNKIIGVKDSIYYIYSYTFNLLSEEKYESAYLNDNGLIVVKKDGKWGIMSSDLEMVTEFVYDDVAVNSQGQVFNGNFAVVKDESGYMLINTDGEACFEARFPNAKGFEGGLIAVSNDTGKWGFINGSGEYIIECQYEDVYSFSYHLAAVKYAGEWGFINRYNEMIIENQFTTVTPFVEGKAFSVDNMGNYKIVSLRYYELFQ